MYKFGNPDQLSAARAAEDPASVEIEGGEGQAQLSREASEANGDFSEARDGPQGSTLEPVVIVNGVQHSNLASPPSADATKDEDVDSNHSISEVNQKLDSLELEGTPSVSPVANGIAAPAEVLHLIIIALVPFEKRFQFRKVCI